MACTRISVCTPLAEDERSPAKRLALRERLRNHRVMNVDGTLHGIRVLDLSQAISGPFIGRMLADLGADVVKVEWPNGDVTNRFGPTTAGHTGLFTHMNAGKRGIGVDLKAEGGVQLLRKLAAKADIAVENFRPGVLDRAGLGYDDLSADHPGLIMVSVSGFGRTSPDSQRQAYAPVIHAESGMLSRIASIDDAPVADVLVSIADEIASLHATVAVLAALNYRNRTGTGQHIDLSMLEALLATDDHISDAIDANTAIADSRGYVWDAVGGPIMISADKRTTWQRLAKSAGLVDPTPPGAAIAEKAANRHNVMADWIASFDDRRLLTQALDAANLAWADVRDNTNVFDAPSLRGTDVVQHVDNHQGGQRGVIRMPYRFSAAESGVRGPAPRRGEHNAQVLQDWLGIDLGQVESLLTDGVLTRSSG